MTAVREEGPVVWNVVDGPLPGVGEAVTGEIDWGRRVVAEQASGISSRVVRLSFTGP